ncbi:aminoglycoside phosphotransferase family protein [Oceanobacillus sojae]|uniref:aminoglycoside phosphotransferase family protein n=1 Tax=Oceanobacillus sojae TaxID=582851 RepID=UPI0021A726BC|nr:aminoglycoside phosphotransferase family protein [Oceanobacillus sojae]MCT1904342.1 aminoglycoside phosphotransferase family protein [Oceanobacillus sojae]
MSTNALIAKGNTAEIYLHNNKIVKVFNDYLPDTEAEMEAGKQRIANSAGLPVPKVFDVSEFQGKQAIMMEYIKGSTLGDLYLSNKEQAEYYLAVSVDIQQKIHRVIPNLDASELMYDKLCRQIKAAVGLTEKYKNDLLRRLDTMTFENRLCHGDFHLFNLISADGKMYIIDWVDSSAGDIRADVCRTYLLYSQHFTELADSYLQIYCEKSGLSKEEILQWAPIIAGARLSEQVSTENTAQWIEIINSYRL